MSVLHIVCPHCDAVNRIPPDRPATAGKCGACKKKLFEGQPLTLDARRWRSHAERGDLPLLVDFWAAWCGPCKAMAPTFAAAAAELEPAVRLAKVDVDAQTDLAARFQVRSVPTLVLLAHGREVARAAGAMPLPALVRWTREQLRGIPG